MIQLIVRDLEGKEKTVQGRVGMTLMETLRDAGFDDLRATCGGSCSCATCQVYIDPAFAGRLPPMTVDERELLDGSAYCKPESRLSCEIRVTDELAGLRLTIAPAE